MQAKNKIEKQNIEDIIALTSMQQGMLFHYLKNPNGREYFEQLCIRFKGKISIESIERAWEYVIRSNEMLRTIFRWDRLETPVQVVLKEYTPSIKIMRLQDVDQGEKEKYINEIRKKDLEVGIDISVEPMRITLIQICENELEMVISNHHILYDGWSNSIIIKEFVEAYKRFYKGLKLEPIKKTRFKEYIKWRKLQDRDIQKDYWRKYLEGYSHKISISGKKLIHESNNKIDRYRIELDKILTAVIVEFCREEKITVAVLLNTAWGILLQRYNNTDDVVFGITKSGRTASINGIDNIVGLFINTIPIRISVKDGESIKELLKRVDREIKDIENYDSIPLAEIQAESKLGNSEGLFDTLLAIENYPLDKTLRNMDGILTFEIADMYTETNYDIAITITTGEKLGITAIYNRYKYTGETIERVFKHYTNIISEITADNKKPVKEIEMLDIEEKKKLLYDYNNDESNYVHGKPVHIAFEEQAEKTPAATALIFGEKRLTFRELNKKANQLAWLLKKKGVKGDKVVGVILERSIEMLVSLLGVLKAGGAYLPLDPGYPTDRIMTMLDKSDTSVLLTSESTLNAYPLISLENIGFNEIDCDISISAKEENAKSEELMPFLENGDKDAYDSSKSVIILEYAETLLSKESEENPPVEINGENTIYQIYTSGSTGIPKGAMVKHHSFSNLLKWYTCEFDINNTDHMLLIASISFDLAQPNIYATLIKGGELYLFEAASYDYERMSDVIYEKGITILSCTPTAFFPLLELNEDSEYKKLVTLRYVFLGGEPINMTALQKWIKSPNYHCEIVNIYGPTECTDVISSYTVDNETADKLTSVPIGKPIYNTHLYVLDKELRILPFEVEGELYAGGVCVGKGYYKDDKLTKERFIEVKHLPDKLIYKTGDVVKRLSDGNLEFIGRIDNQVKIRGYRIETGEIEARLLKHSGVKEAAVIVREDKAKQKYICAYFISENEIETSALIEFMKEELPSYMLPTFFIRIESIPQTPSGKVDRKVLTTALYEPKSNEKNVLPTDEIEKKLVDIWCKVLGISNIGIHDNFFELGGHSLKAVQAINLLYKTLNIKISIQTFFKYQTIASLGKYLRSCERAEYEEIEKLPKRDWYELSYAQKRLWIINQKEPSNTAYNMSGRILLSENVDLEVIHRTFIQLINRHESLRTCIKIVEGCPRQIIEDEIDFEMPLKDLSCIEEKTRAEELAQIYKKKAEYIFNLEEAPLFKVELVKLTNEQYELILCMHHIISDGWSMSILKKEFTDIYEAYKNGKIPDMKPLMIQYKDYAAWQNKQIESSSKMEEAKNYWLKQLKNEAPLLRISNKYQGTQANDSTGEVYRIIIDKMTKEKLKVIAKEEKTTLFIVLLSALNIYLVNFTGQSDILIGTAGSGREHESLEKVMGYFINTTILRNQVYKHEIFSKALLRINDNTLKALEYQNFPLEKIVEELNVKYPKISIFFNMLNMGDSEKKEISDIDIYGIEEINEIKFDITFYLTEYSNGIELICTYKKSLFKESRIAYMLAKYSELLGQIAENQHSLIADYFD